jgi:hypothetical protein
MPEEYIAKKKRVGLFLPSLLISMGVIFLWVNLSGQSENGWFLILQFWPIILILGGIDGLYQGKSSAIHTFWISFGLALLLGNMGRLSWTSWEILFGLWPIFVISIGFDFILGGNTVWRRLVAGVLVLLVITGSVWLFDSTSILTPLEELKIEQSRNVITQADIILKPSVGFLKVISQGNTESLVEGNLKVWDGEKVEEVFRVEGDQGVYELSSSGLPFIYQPGTKSRASWVIGVSPRLSVNLVVDQTIGEIELELSDMRVNSIQSNLVFGKTQVNLPSNTRLTGQLVQTMGLLVINVPEDTPLQVKGIPALGNLVLPDDYIREGDLVRSPGFAASQNQVSLTVNLVIGEIIIRQR